jgi:hypothetical protein
LKSTPTPKPPTPKTVEPKNSGTADKPATPVADKPAESTASGSTAETKADASNAKTEDTKDPAPVRPTAGTTRAGSGSQMKLGAVPSATSTVERDVLVSFRTFASNQRFMAEKARTTKAKVDKEVKLTELKKFAQSFKLSTPVPKDLISIIAKDPAKLKQIQE